MHQVRVCWEGGGSTASCSHVGWDAAVQGLRVFTRYACVCIVCVCVKGSLLVFVWGWVGGKHCSPGTTCMHQVRMRVGGRVGGGKAPGRGVKDLIDWLVGWLVG